MCPLCIATVAWIAAGTTSTGGITALTLSKFRGRRKKDQQQANLTTSQGERHGQEQSNDDGRATNRVA
jgi:hypothetical protein